MHPGTLQRLLHRWLTEWDISLLSARKDLAFSFSMDGEQAWDWLRRGGYSDVCVRARQTLAEFRLPDFLADYWISCFFSDYYSEGLPRIEDVRGPPYLVIACPVASGDGEFARSVEAGREEFEAGGGGPMAGPAQWQRRLEIARRQTAATGRERDLARWICCFTPESERWTASRMVDSEGWLDSPDDLDRFPCERREVRERPRAYPSGIDWSGSLDLTDDDRARDELAVRRMEEIRVRGFDTGVVHGADGTRRVTLSWDPRLVDVRTAGRAAEEVQRQHGPAGRGARDAGDRLGRLIAERIDSAKQPGHLRAESARRRYSEGKATFAELLMEEALRAETQEACRRELSSAGSETARRRVRRLMVKRVDSRLRKWLLPVERHPRLGKGERGWWRGIFSD